MKKEALRVTSTVPVAPTTLYFAWIDSEHHSSMTGETATIDPTVGAKFSTCNGYVTGKLVILDLGRRIVMSWRTTDFPRDAVDSRVEVHFETLGLNTRLLVLHTDIPEGQSEKYKDLWNDKYVAPMRAYFSKFLPDPRNPPVRRPPPPPPENDDDDEAPIVHGKLRPKVASAPPSTNVSSAKRVVTAKSAGAKKPGVHKVEGGAMMPAPAPKASPPSKITKAAAIKAPAAKASAPKTARPASGAGKSAKAATKKAATPKKKAAPAKKSTKPAKKKQPKAKPKKKR